MSGSNKSYLPSQRMMPTYTTVPSQLEDREPSPDFPYDPEPSPEGGSGGPVMDPRQSPLSLPSGVFPGQNSRASVSEQSLAAATVAAYGRQGFPYGLSGVPMPTYNYGSELYNYVSNGFPRKSRMCTYCNKIFTRSTTRRYHEKRCPLLRAAGSLMSSSTSDLASDKGLGLSSSSVAATVSSVITSAYANSGVPTGSYADYPAQGHTSTSSVVATSAGDPSPNSFAGGGGGKSEVRDFSDSSSNLSGSRPEPSRYPTDSKAGVTAMFSPLREGSNGSPVGMVTENISEAGSLDNEVMTLIKPSSVNGSEGNLTVAGGARSGDRPEMSPPFMGGLQPKTSPSCSSGLLLDDSSPNAFRVKKEAGEGMREASDVGASFQNEMLTEGLSSAPSKMQGPYPCRFCGEGFFKESSRAAHERVHAGEKAYPCILCSEAFASKSAIHEHMFTNHREGPFLCKYCQTSFPDTMTFKAHLESHDLPKAEKESAFRLGCTSGKDADSPELDGEDDDSNTCSSIDGEDKEEVNGDMETTVEAEEGLEAKENSTEASTTFETVVNGSNSRDKMWCHICKQEIARSMWRFHERVHADEKPYECSICHKRFGYKNNMKSHMKLHAGIKPYQCHVCGAKFTRGSTLRRHARRHGYRAESVYDLYLNKRGIFKPPDHPPQLTLASVQAAAQSGRPSAEADASSSRSAALDAAKAVADSPLGYDLSRYASHSPGGPYLTGGYPASGSLPQSMYPGLPATTSSLLPYGSSYSAAASHAVQSDALNLSLHSKVGQSPSMSFAEEEMGAGRGGVPPSPPGRHGLVLASESDRRPTPQLSPPEAGLRQLSSPGILGRMTPQQELRGVFQHPQGHLGLLASQRSFGVQVNLCCGTKGAGAGFGSDLRMMSPCGSDGSGSVATSPALSSTGADPRDLEPLTALVGAGKLFRCELCECYFTDYPMYRIHKKLHLPARPFQCPVCSEDCHDKVYFSIHVYEHLR